MSILLWGLRMASRLLFLHKTNSMSIQRTLLIFLFLAVGLCGRATQLSPGAEIQLLTADPGAELYSAFGHSAFRVLDRAKDIDLVYNYGTFDFETPGFYVKFVRGKLPYFLSTQSLRGFQYQYIREQRKVVQQVLNLNPAEVQAVFDYLENNMRPENRAYQYDFFFDNCATRERDVLEQVLGDRLKWPVWSPDSLGSYRDLTEPYLAPRHWTDFGIDLMLGSPTDAEAGLRGAQFLPDYLYASVKQAWVKHNGQWQPLVRGEQPMLTPEQPFQVTEPSPGPVLVFWGLFLVAVVLTWWSKPWHFASRLFDSLVYLLVGVVGVLALFLWLGTDHQATYTNFNVFWALPTYLVLSLVRWGRRSGRQWAVGHLFVTLLFVMASPFLPQAFHVASWPLILTLLLRQLALVEATIGNPERSGAHT